MAMIPSAKEHKEYIKSHVIDCNALRVKRTERTCPGVAQTAGEELEVQPFQLVDG